MTSINNNFFNYSGSLFSNSTTGTSSTGSSNLLGDYLSIRNGSYKKLLKAYYAKEKSESSTSSSKTESDNTASKQLKLMKSDASSLKSAADTLTSRKSTLFEKVTKTTTDENGEKVTKTDYDRDAIYSAVKAFADAYNSTLDSAADQDNLSILRKAAIMTKSTAVNQGLLKDVGITIGEDNKMTVNEEKLKTADISTLKTLFSGYGSYAAGIGQKAADITTISNQLIKSASNSNASLYNRSGNYSSYSSANMYDKLF